MLTETAPIESSRHKCLIYDGHPSEQLPVIIPLLITGLTEKRRCLYLGNSEMIGLVRAGLGEEGVQVDAEMKRGALIFSSDRSYLDDGFDPAAMVSMLIDLVDEAVADGFNGLCATGDMMWELGTESNFDKLQEYEARLEKVFQTKPLMGICQYHRRLVPASAVQNALLTHRSLYVNSNLRVDNIFYMPPDILLEHRDQQGKWMCDQILRVMRAEEKRDSALSALTESEAHERELAEELARANEDLERRIEERTLELREVNKELESFSYSVSHDLRAPLRAIDGFSKILMEDFAAQLGTDGRDSLQRICGNVKQMEELIEGMLTLARMAKTEIRNERVNLSELAETEIANLRRSNPARSAEVTIQQDLYVTGDRSLLRAALSNLLGNAWKFTSKRATAKIEFGTESDEDGRPVFFVRDNGDGFDLKNATKLFTVFQRFHSHEQFPGTGVGLATVHRIVGRHGGRIWADSHPDEGATFFFTLQPPDPCPLMVA